MIKKSLLLIGWLALAIWGFMLVANGFIFLPSIYIWASGIVESYKLSPGAATSGINYLGLIPFWYLVGAVGFGIFLSIIGIKRALNIYLPLTMFIICIIGAIVVWWRDTTDWAIQMARFILPGFAVFMVMNMIFDLHNKLRNKSKLQLKEVK